MVIKNKFEKTLKMHSLLSFVNLGNRKQQKKRSMLDGLHFLTGQIKNLKYRISDTKRPQNNHRHSFRVQFANQILYLYSYVYHFET